MMKPSIQKTHKEVVEVEASTSSLAIKKALTKLGAKRSEVDIVLLREEHKGLFSMKGSKLAKIRATKKIHKK